MNIRKFIAPTARQALKDIRNVLGDEAVILSNRKIDEGVEIIALANEEITHVTESVVREKASSARHKEQTARSAPLAHETSILVEIKSMHRMLQQQLAALSGSRVPQQDPQSAGFLCTLLNAGFSAQLARQFLDNMPAGKPLVESWVYQVL